LSKFPTQQISELFWTSRELNSVYQGIFFGEQRNHFEVHSATASGVTDAKKVPDPLAPLHCDPYWLPFASVYPDEVLRSDRIQKEKARLASP
jgi:hypothetical protein